MSEKRISHQANLPHTFAFQSNSDDNDEDDDKNSKVRLYSNWPTFLSLTPRLSIHSYSPKFRKLLSFAFHINSPITFCSSHPCSVSLCLISMFCHKCFQTQCYNNESSQKRHPSQQLHPTGLFLTLVIPQFSRQLWQFFQPTARKEKLQYLMQQYLGSLVKNLRVINCNEQY